MIDDAILPGAGVTLFVDGEPVQARRGQTVATVCLHLLAAELNIRFSYPLLTQRDGAPAVALAVDDNTLAGQILLRKRFTLLGEEDLG